MSPKVITPTAKAHYSSIEHRAAIGSGTSPLPVQSGSHHLWSGPGYISSLPVTLSCKASISLHCVFSLLSTHPVPTVCCQVFGGRTDTILLRCHVRFELTEKLAPEVGLPAPISDLSIFVPKCLPRSLVWRRACSPRSDREGRDWQHSPRRKTLCPETQQRLLLLLHDIKC